MQPDNDDAACLWDMIEAAKKVLKFTSDVDYEDYINDPKLQMAVERGVEIIGEAARRVSEEFQEAHPEIPWGPIIAQRNVLAHEYGEIDQQRIWALTTTHIPDLIAKLKPLIPSLSRDED
jgi:uncharacterized protein with HEPN domain